MKKGSKKDRNKYVIVDDLLTIVYIVNRKGQVFECFIDTKNLQKISDMLWHVRYDRNTNGYYANTTVRYTDENGSSKSTSKDMHSLLMGTTRGRWFVDHINNKGLDNREENLRICENKQNLSNRKTKNANNTSTQRNVCLIGDKWVVQIQVDGKNKRLKSFPSDQLEEAGKYAEEMRHKYYGTFSGNN